MPKVVYDFKVDMKIQIDAPEIVTTVGDSSGDVFNIALTSSGKAFSLTDASSVTITMKKPDNTVVVGEATIVDASKGTITYTLGAQESAVAGTVNATIEVYGTASRTTSFGFSFTVVAELDNGEAIPSTNEFTVLGTLIAADAARTTSENIRVTNETARGTAESGRVTAESDRDTAEIGRVTAENLREEHEGFRIENELTRSHDESVRLDNEAARETAEAARVSAFNANEAARQTNETARISSETNRVDAESDRAIAEADRVDAESARANSENTRISNENTRIAGESSRSTSETNRANAESARVTSEAGRVSAETGRATAFATSETSRANTFNAAETLRTAIFDASEDDRDATFNSAEATRTSIFNASEAARTTNEASRATAEIARVGAENSRVATESSRVSAESARMTGYNAMVQASYVIPKAPVATFADIATTYPAPSNGWSTRATDTGKVYRYNSFNLTWEWVDTITASSYDSLLNQVLSANMSTPTDYTAIVTSLPSTANMGELKTVIKGRTSDTTTIATDFNNISTGGSGDALNATMKLYKGSVDPLALPTPTSNYKNELTYTPSTWGEWTKSSGVVGDSTGIEFTTNGSTTANAYVATNFKPSTKYGILYNVVSNSIVNEFGFDGSVFNYKPIQKTIGNNKIIQAANASISVNRCYLYTHTPTEPAGNKIKIKDIRIYELPVGSAIENDFNTLSADELASKYIFDSTGTTQTATLGTQITDVSKLKTQNETPLTSVNTVGRTAVYNGKTLVVQSASQPAVRDDFAGKVAGSTVVCPNVAKYDTSSTLIAPSAFTTELPQGSIDLLKTLNSEVTARTTSVNGEIAKKLFSFNLIRIVEDKYGTIPSADQTVAGKVAWLKTNLSSIKLNWTGYGSCPSGSKAFLRFFDRTMVTWRSTGTPSMDGNTSSSPTTIINPDIMLYEQSVGVIQSDGFIHFLAYTDASDGVTASTIYTDYINIELQFKPVAGYDLLVDTNPRRDSGMADMVNLQKVFANITDDYAGKVAGSDVVCANVSKWVNNATLQAPSGTWSSEFTTGGYNYINTLNGTSYTGTTSVNLESAQQIFSFNLIRMFKDANGYDIPIDYTGVPATDLANQVQWLKDNLNSIATVWTGFGSCPAGNKATLMAWRASDNSWQGSITGNTSTPSSLTMNPNPLTYIDVNGFVHILAYTDASNGTIASTINTDYIKLDLTFKNPNNSMLMFTNASVELENLTNGKSQALLVELDLSTICTNLFGGDNAKLKSALKSIQVDIWAMGSGAVSGELGYNSKLQLWGEAGANDFAWRDPNKNNSTNAIANITYLTNISPNTLYKINATNKVYFIIYAPYASDGIIPSQVSLDYIKTTVSLTRVLSESAYKVRSCGKNLFDGKNIYGKWLDGVTGLETVDITSCITNFIPILSNTIYTFNKSFNFAYYYDKSKNFIGRLTYASNLTSLVGSCYMRVGSYHIANPNYFDGFQLELGSTATVYEAYKETVTYTLPVELRSVGSVTDTHDLNSGLLTKRIEQKVLQASDVTFMMTTNATVDYAGITKPADAKSLNNTTDMSIVSLEGYSEIPFSTDDASNIGKFALKSSNNYIYVGFTEGTTLAQAQTALTGKKLTYVLATPITTQYDAQIIDAYPSGTVYCEPMIRDTFKYTTKVDIVNTLYPIKALTKLYKVVGGTQEEVVMTPIDVSTCTIAGDGLSFTSTALALNDIVEYEYEFEAWRTLIPTLNLSYPNNLRGVVDGNVVQIARLDGKIENLEHFTVAMLLNHEMRLVAHSI